MAEDREKEVLIPEVLPPDHRRGEAPNRHAPGGKPVRPRLNWNQRFYLYVYPIGAGVVVDLINHAMRPGILGLIVGVLCGLWFAASARVPCGFWIWVVGISAAMGASGADNKRIFPVLTLMAVALLFRRR